MGMSKQTVDNGKILTNAYLLSQFMTKKRCEMCGCIMEDTTDSTICECCLDDMRKEEEE